MRFLPATLLATSLATAGHAQAPAPRIWDTYSDTWVATDALGRQLPTFEQVGPPRKDRFVAVFYFLWLGPHVNGGPYDITKILAQDPQAMQKHDSPLWGPLGAFHHWGESLFGYYLTDDSYVLRKHAQMLSDAGVDAIIFDVTNQITYKQYYMTLLKVFSEIRQNGGKTPQIAFLCPFGNPERVVPELYRDLYKPGLYPDLWCRWEGKPLILADPDRLADAEGNDQHDAAVALTLGHTLGQSFTTAHSFDAVAGCFPTWTTKDSALTLSLRRDGPGGPPVASQRFVNVEDNAWLSLRFNPPLPAGTYYLEMSNPKGTVGWWSNTADVYPHGEALADGKPVSGDRTLRISLTDGPNAEIRRFFTFRKPQASYFEGPTGPDQWSWLEVYPQHVFRNSRGEKEQMSVGVAQNAVDSRIGSMSEPNSKGRSWHNGAMDPAPDAVLHGYNFAEQFERALKEDPKALFITGWNEWIAGRFDEFAGVKAPVMFVDEFDEEHSRDIEPMKGGHGDNYYYEMVSYIRRYKGVRRPPEASGPKKIDLDGPFSQWADVAPEFRDDIGDTAHRDHPGWNNCEHYVNNTGRNDFVTMKVAVDTRNVYFYVRTKDPITPSSDPNWMMLFIDADQNHATGWEGYDFIVNRTVKDATTTLLEENQGGWTWKPKAEVRFRVQGNEMMLSVRRADLGMAGKPVHFDFKWADNIQKPGDINEFTINGDAAPIGRFNYRYTARDDGM
jgi:hypothetical protein